MCILENKVPDLTLLSYSSHQRPLSDSMYMQHCSGLLNRLQMCILAGCDFLKALSKIGIKKAHTHLRKFKTFVRVGRPPLATKFLALHH